MGVVTIAVGAGVVAWCADRMVLVGRASRVMGRCWLGVVVGQCNWA